jgi:nucleotide-binding universal stress UspA family protein
MRLAGATDEELAQYRVDLRLRAVDRLRALAHEFGGQGNIDATIVRAGDVRFELTRVVQQERIDLVSIGRQGQGLLGHALLGSVTAWTLEHADCDVLVVPAAAAKGRP